MIINLMKNWNGLKTFVSQPIIIMEQDMLFVIRFIEMMNIWSNFFNKIETKCSKVFVSPINSRF